MSFIETGSIRELDIFNLQGQVTIKVHDKNEVLVETDNEDKIEFRVKGKCLQIKAKPDKDKEVKNTKDGFFSNVFNLNIGNNNVSIINGSYVYNNGAEITKVDMKIFVPRDKIENVSASGVIEVTVVDISKKLSIDGSGQTSFDIEGTHTLNVDVSGQSKVNADNVGEFFADVSGQSNVKAIGKDFTIAEVDVSGQSNVTIISESINTLEVDSSGQSRVVVRGKVNNKSIDKSGQSSVIFKDA